MSSDSAELPDDVAQLHPLPLQAAGHPQSIFRDERAAGRVLKPVSERERRFYDDATQLAEWRAVLPAYFGATHSHDHQLLIALQDLTFRFRRPCVLDVKMGRSSAGEDASEHKRADMMAKDAATTSHSLGLRVCGMHVFDPRLGAHRSRSKAWGKRLTDDTFRAGLHCYFNATLFDDEASLSKQPNERICIIIRHFIVRLDAIADLMRAQSRYRFYSSSLLFVYEGDKSDVEQEEEEEVALAMIDMAHVFPLNADDGLGDNGYVDALATLRTHLLAILAIEESLHQ